METTNRRTDDTPRPSEPLQWGDAPALDLVALKAAAQAATPGPWLHNADDNIIYPESGGASLIDLCVRSTNVGVEQRDTNAAYIAAANPAAILALLDRLERAEIDLGNAKYFADKLLESRATKAWSGELPEPALVHKTHRNGNKSGYYSESQMRTAIGAALEAAAQACERQKVEVESYRRTAELDALNEGISSCIAAIRALNKLAPAGAGAAQVGAPSTNIIGYASESQLESVRNLDDGGQGYVMVMVRKSPRRVHSVPLSAPGMPPQSAPTEPHSAPQSAVAVPQDLLTRISDAFENYERHGAVCEFEGNSMIYASTLVEIAELAQGVGVLEAAAPTDAEREPLNGIKATLAHDEGAIARCSYCGRYSLDPNTLGARQPICECGQQHGWSGSFVRPDANSKWSGKAPAGTEGPRDE